MDVFHWLRNIVIIYHKEEKPLAYLKLIIEDSQFRETSTNQHSNEKHHKWCMKRA